MPFHSALVTNESLSARSLFGLREWRCWRPPYTRKETNEMNRRRGACAWSASEPLGRRRIPVPVTTCVVWILVRQGPHSDVFINWCHHASLSRSRRCANSWIQCIGRGRAGSPSQPTYTALDVLLFFPSLRCWRTHLVPPHCRLRLWPFGSYQLSPSLALHRLERVPLAL